MNKLDIAIAWLACGAVAHGLMLAHFQNKWPRLAAEHWKDDFISCAGLSFFLGPLALIDALILLWSWGELSWRGPKYGFRLW